MMRLFGKKKKTAASIDALATLNVEQGSGESLLPSALSSQGQGPALVMPKPRYAIAPTQELSKAYDKNDKIQVEHDSPAPLSPVERQPIGSVDSAGTFVSALQSPEPADHTDITTAPHDTEAALPNPASSEQESQQQRNLHLDIEALRQKAIMIQAQYDAERAEWEKREQAHRLLEKQMMEQLSLAHDQLLRALAERGLSIDEAVNPAGYPKLANHQHPRITNGNAYSDDERGAFDQHQQEDSGYMENCEDECVWPSGDLRMRLSSSLVTHAPRFTERHGDDVAQTRALCHTTKGPGPRPLDATQHDWPPADYYNEAPSIVWKRRREIHSGHWPTYPPPHHRHHHHLHHSPQYHYRP